jgi:hypothetical protein
MPATMIVIPRLATTDPSNRSASHPLSGEKTAVESGKTASKIPAASADDPSTF